MRALQLPRNFFAHFAVRLLLTVAAGSICWGQQIFPPSVPPPPAQIPAYQQFPARFDMIGFIEYASLDGGSSSICSPGDADPAVTKTLSPAGCKSTGGWIQINNHVIRVPKNTVLQFPAATATWEEVFELNTKAGHVFVPGESGMALADIARLPGTFEAHVQGNIVNGMYIAGLIFISQEAANTSQGFIESIDYAHSTLTVNGKRVQINDPQIQITDRLGNTFTKGRYSAGQPQGTTDKRFAVDQNNATIRSQTGYPMCIPRTNPLTQGDLQCPSTNRPIDPTTNDFKRIFTMDANQGNNPWAEAPLEVGDFVTYIGTLMIDNQGPFISANTIIANVGIFTVPGVDPAYISIDVVLEGTGGLPNPGFPEEVDARNRVEGFATDPSRTVDVSAIDIDCNGIISFRTPNWVTGFPIEQGEPVIGVKGRWRFRPAGGNFLPATQSVGARISNPDGGLLPGGPAFQTLNDNGLVTNQFQAPNMTFIFPENLVVGAPQPMGNFLDLLFLRNGVGPWPTQPTVWAQTNAPTPVFTSESLGPITPFPDSITPSPLCTSGSGPGGSSVVAKATANPPGPVDSGVTVILDATGSVPSTGPFLWSQLSGPTVTITNSTANQASFVSPSVTSPATVIFQVQVGSAATGVATATVAVRVDATPATATAAASPAGPVTSGTAVTLDATGSTPAAGPFLWTQTAGPPVTIANSATVQAGFTAPSVSAPTTFTFQVQVGSGAAPATATVSVLVNPAASAAAPTVSAVATYTDPTAPSSSSTGNPITVPSKSSIILTARASDSANGTLTYVWSADPGNAMGTPDLSSPATSSPAATFTAPNVPAGSTPVSLLFHVKVTSSASNLSSTADVTVVVNPAASGGAADNIVVSSVVYRRLKGRLQITVTDSTPGVKITATLVYTSSAPPQGVSLSGVMGPAIPATPGGYSIIFDVPPPDRIDFTSRGGGTASSPITSFR